MTAGGTLPPNANPAVKIPAPPEYCLEVFKAPPGPQLVPLYSSVAVVPPGDPTHPPATTPAV